MEWALFSSLCIDLPCSVLVGIEEYFAGIQVLPFSITILYDPLVSPVSMTGDTKLVTKSSLLGLLSSLLRAPY